MTCITVKAVTGVPFVESVADAVLASQIQQTLKDKGLDADVVVTPTRPLSTMTGAIPWFLAGTVFGAVVGWLVTR